MLQPIEHLVILAVCLYNMLLTSNYSQSIMMIRSDIMAVIGWMECFLSYCDDHYITLRFQGFDPGRVIAPVNSLKMSCRSYPPLGSVTAVPRAVIFRFCLL